MNRRRFIGQTATVGLAAALGDWRRAFAAGMKDAGVGRPWKGWMRGELQAHFIYTGRAESTFLIFPDGTTMLVDSGDYDVPQRVLMQTPVLPDRSRGAGEWIARYVQRANPFGNKVDYMMLTHWHADHAGCETSYSRREERDGDDWFVSGFAETCDFIDFGKAFDRCWPDLNDPFPLKDRTCREVSQISRMYRYLERHKGLKVEKFRVGARDQVVLLKDPGAFPDFQVCNICGNGKILMRDGSIRNLYEGIFTPNHATGWRNENGMSCGMILSYGAFRLYMAGDFQDFWQRADGSRFEVEDALGEQLDQVDVAKVNHHGSASMTETLVRALAAKVWVSCIFAKHCNDLGTLRRLSSRKLYPGERVICPTAFPAERMEAANAEGLHDVAPESLDCGHIVLNVPAGGRDYTVSYLTACDESMTVRSVMRFKSHAVPSNQL